MCRCFVQESGAAAKRAARIHTVLAHVVRFRIRTRLTTITITAAATALLLVAERIVQAALVHERHAVAPQEHADVVEDIVIGVLRRVVELARTEGVFGFALDGGELARRHVGLRKPRERERGHAE